VNARAVAWKSADRIKISGCWLIILFLFASAFWSTAYTFSEAGKIKTCTSENYDLKKRVACESRYFWKSKENFVKRWSRRLIHIVHLCLPSCFCIMLIDTVCGNFCFHQKFYSHSCQFRLRVVLPSKATESHCCASILKNFFPCRKNDSIHDAFLVEKTILYMMLSL